MSHHALSLTVATLTLFWQKILRLSDQDKFKPFAFARLLTMQLSVISEFCNLRTFVQALSL